MALRETIEKLVADFVHEVLTLMTTSPLSELAELERRPLLRPPVLRRPDPIGDPSEPAPPAPAPGGHRGPESSTEPEPRNAAPVEPAPLPITERLDDRIVVSAEKRGIGLDDLLLTSRLDGVLAREGYVVLGDLDGRTLAELGRYRGFGRLCQRELRQALARLGIVVPPPRVTSGKALVPRIEVPEFATEYRLDEMPLGAASAFRKRFTVLGELHGKSSKDLRGIPYVGRVAIGDIFSVVAAIAAAGPPAPAGLLDLLDVALDVLPEDRREVLLLRLGGGGADPLTLAEVGRRTHRSVTPERVRQIKIDALATLRRLAGPHFGAKLRELEQRAQAGETDLRAELARHGRASSPPAPPRTWSSPAFYERLVTELSRGLTPHERGTTRVLGRDDAREALRPSDQDARTASGHEHQDGNDVPHDRGGDPPPALSGDASSRTVRGASEEGTAADPTRRNDEHTRTDEQRAADDAALLASGEPLARLSEIAPMLGVSAKTLRWVVQRRGGPIVRYVSSPRPVRHCIADVRAAVEAARPDIEARRRRAEEIEAAERARGEASRAAKAAAPRKTNHVTSLARPRPVARAPALATRSKQSGPEVLLVRRRGPR